MGYTAQGGLQIRRGNASDHAAANCSSPVFYSALHRQPVQIHKRKGDDMPGPGSPADKTSSTVHHTPNFVYEFLRNTSQQGTKAIQTGQHKRCDKDHYGLSSEEPTNRSDFLDLEVCGLANYVDLLPHGEPIFKHDTQTTGRIAKRHTTLTDSKNIRKIRRPGRAKEQSFCLIFIQLKLVVDGPLLYIAHSFACCRKESQCCL